MTSPSTQYLKLKSTEFTLWFFPLLPPHPCLLISKFCSFYLRIIISQNLLLSSHSPLSSSLDQIITSPKYLFLLFDLCSRLLPEWVFFLMQNWSYYSPTHNPWMARIASTAQAKTATWHAMVLHGRQAHFQTHLSLWLHEMFTPINSAFCRDHGAYMQFHPSLHVWFFMASWHSHASCLALTDP